MTAAKTDLNFARMRAGLSLAAYKADTIRFASRSLAGATHLVASRKGLYAVNEREWSLIAHGFFFGVTLRGDDIFVFEACDRPRSTVRRGRILRLTRNGDELTGKVMVTGLDNGCHQIDFLRDRLHVIDTYNQVVLRFSADSTAYETLTPLPTTPQGRWDNRAVLYSHVNSILEVDDKVLLLLHNGSAHSGRTSEIAIYNRSWQELDRWQLDGRGCHGLAMLEDGTLLTCDSMAGDLISVRGFRHHVSPNMTRGLAVGPDTVAVGASTFADREERLATSGTVTFMDREYRLRSVLELPGAPTEIRRLDGRDSGLSHYLAQVAWGKNIQAGVPVQPALGVE